MVGKSTQQEGLPLVVILKVLTVRVWGNMMTSLSQLLNNMGETVVGHTVVGVGQVFEKP